MLAGFQARPRAYWGTGWQPNPNREGLPKASNGVVDRGFTFCRLLYQDVVYEVMAGRPAISRAIIKVRVDRLQ